MGYIAHPLSVLASAILFVLHLGVGARAITRPNRSPASRVAWVAVIMSLPLVGVIAYLLLGETSIGRQRERRLRGVLTHLDLPDHTAPDVPESYRTVIDLARTINGFDATHGNRIELLGDPGAPASDPKINSDIAADALVAEIDRATETIHISFYIWLDDHNGGRVVDAVCAAARRGVVCRVMVDALGSRPFTRSPRWRQLREAGVRTLATLNDVPRLGHLAVGRLDLRNHRKIVVIDNRVSFCGSQNCADPEFRIAAKYAPWVDLWLRCEGPVVRQEQYLFLTAWIAETGEQGLDALPVAQEVPAPNGGVIAQMFGTGPTTLGNAMSDMFVATIFSARAEVQITTPYFVPDEALLRAVCAAPRRGVRTQIVLPQRNNSRLVGASSRSTYAAMLQAGVEIYEYRLGLLHSKSITVDGQLALVGSANMDRRSLQLNFENNLIVVDPRLTAAIKARQDGYVSQSDRVGLETVHAWPYRTRLLQNLIGMMSPVL